MSNQQRTVGKDSVVLIEYTLTLDDGEVYDSSSETGPLQYLHGHDQLIAGLEAALEGMAVGATKSVVVTPEYGYGEYDPEAVELAPLDTLPADMELEPGMAVGLYDEETGEEIEAFVTEIRSDGVLLDMNHPLAGETLHFQVEVLGVRPATPEEIAHGHAHGDEDDF